MFTKCPECDATFRVSEEQLTMADGLVRCGLCDEVFNGNDYAFEENQPQEKPPEIESHPTTSKVEEIEYDSVDIDDIADEELDDENIEKSELPSALQEDLGANITLANNNVVNVLWTLGAIGLLVFLLGQLTYWQNINLLPASWIEKTCTIFPCAEQPDRDINAIKVLNRHIYSHPNTEDALMITATIVSQASFEQPFPILEINLLNVHGEVVALRQFSADEYLVYKDYAVESMIPNKPVGARLEVIDPGSEVMAYELKFY